MQDQGAMAPVADGMALGDAVSRLLADPEELRRRAQAAGSLCRKPCKDHGSGDGHPCPLSGGRREWRSSAAGIARHWMMSGNYR